MRRWNFFSKVAVFGDCLVKVANNLENEVYTLDYVGHLSMNLLDEYST